MGKYVATAFLLIFLVFFLPFLWGPVSGSQPVSNSQPASGLQPASNSQPEVPDVPDRQDETDGPEQYDASVEITVLIGGQAQRMDLQTYLQGVVRAEMPASFELEALKAQAVAARTYTLHKIANGGSANHPDADACDDIGCCQAFRSYEEAAAGWGGDVELFEDKIRQAVAGTDGECILYEGEPVLAVFHSSSAGVTQDASAVWSQSLPYLQSVETPETAETVPNYCSTAVFTASELKNKLQTALPEADLSGSPSNWFTNLRQEPNGTVTAVNVGGVTVSGTKLRGILELRSACFTVSFDGDTVLFSVTGYGHGVGMSQYGANVLAADGMGYQEILTWYYTGTAIGKPGHTSPGGESHETQP